MMFFFFNDTATTEIYTLSLHDALPISPAAPRARARTLPLVQPRGELAELLTAQYPQHPLKHIDRKSTRLNSSHANISYAVFCLKKKKIISNNNTDQTTMDRDLHTCDLL